MKHLPEYVLKDLTNKAADDVMSAVRRTADLADHPHDRTAILLGSMGGILVPVYLLMRAEGIPPAAVIAYITGKLSLTLTATVKDTEEDILTALKATDAPHG